MTTTPQPGPRPGPPAAAGARHDYGAATEGKVDEVVKSAQRYGESSIVALAGVPGTGKSFVARIASQRLAGDPERVLEVQFHPSSSYEEFIEGMRIEPDGSISPSNGAFLDWNALAQANPDETYVVLIDEFSRADVSAVLGEVLTFVEDRSRSFTATYSRSPVRIATNLRVLVTYNPTDRSALEIDNALLRRLRIIDFPPDTDQLREMLRGRLTVPVLDRIAGMFDAVKAAHADLYEHQMPFGHGVFAEIRDEMPDLYELWRARLRHMLRRPLVAPHPFTGAIEASYPWRSSSYRLDVTTVPELAIAEAYEGSVANPAAAESTRPSAEATIAGNPAAEPEESTVGAGEGPASQDEGGGQPDPSTTPTDPLARQTKQAQETETEPPAGRP